MTRGFLHSGSIRAAGAKASAAFLCLDRTTTRAKQMARPTKYQLSYPAQAEKLCKLGATDIEIADFFGVDKATINRWKAEYPEFCASVKSGKGMADERVERSLFARAIGYEHDDVDIRVIEGKVVQTAIRKHYPPDSTAGIFWLKNRRGELWRDKQNVEHSGGVTVEITRFGAPKESE